MCTCSSPNASPKGPIHVSAGCILRRVAVPETASFFLLVARGVDYFILHLTQKAHQPQLPSNSTWQPEIVRACTQARAFLEGYSEGCAATVGAVVVTDLRTGASCAGLDTAEVGLIDIKSLLYVSHLMTQALTVSGAAFIAPHAYDMPHSHSCAL